VNILKFASIIYRRISLKKEEETYFLNNIYIIASVSYKKYTLVYDNKWYRNTIFSYTITRLAPDCFYKSSIMVNNLIYLLVN